MSSIKFVVLGLGHIGKRHADIILNNKDAQLIAIIEPNLKIDLSKYQVPFFSSLNDFFASNIETDIVCIATPNYLHCSQAILCMQKGIDIIIEKPMGINVDECNLVIEHSINTKRKVFCVMQNRYSPPSIWLKDIFNKNLLGKIFHVQINCFWNRDENYYLNSNWKGKLNQDGGTLFTQFSHFVDTLYWIFGDITNINAQFNNYNHQQTIEFEDSGFVSFDLLNGGNGSLNYSTSAYHKNIESSITILAENGSIKIGGQYMEKVLHCEIKDYEMPILATTNPPNDYGNYKGSAANHEYVINNAIQTLLGNETIKTSAFEGMKVVEIIERIYETRDLKKLKGNVNG
jgi:UDP-N-acetyl-2-amino-2-deoxyglucuronate dehydrogenase